MAKFNRSNEWNISRSVVIVNLFYLFYYGGKACLFPFITLYFRSLGLSATQTGILCGSKYLIWSITAPLWIFLANRLQKTKVVLGISLLLSIASCLSITLVQPANVTKYLAPCLLEEGQPALLPSDVSTLLPNQTQSVLLTKTSQINTVTEPNVIPTTTTLLSLLTTTTTMTKKSPTTTSQATKTELSLTTLSSLPSTTFSYKSDENLTNYQLAVSLLPDVIKSGVNDEESVKEYLENNKRTSFYPEWKLHVLQTKLVSLLEKNNLIKKDEEIKEETSDKTDEKSVSDAEDNKVEINKKEQPTPTEDSDKLPQEEIQQNPETKDKEPLEDDSENNDTNKQNSGQSQKGSSSSTLEKLLDRLIPLYLERKEQHPSLSIATFLAHEHGTKDLKESVQNYLEAAMERELETDNIEKRSINENELNVTESLNLTTDAATPHGNYFNTTLRKSMEKLVNEVLPSITDNVGIFVLLLAIVIAGESMSAPTEMLSDNAFYEFLDELDSLDKYGRHRLSGLIGTFLCGITISFIVYFSPCVLSGTIVSFHIHFYGFAVLIGFAFLIAPFYPTYTSNSNHSNNRHGIGLCPSCSSLFCSDCRHTLLLLTVFLVGVTQAAVQDFILWEVQDLEGSTEVIYGSYVSASAFCGIISMMISRRVLKALKPCVTGPLSLFCIALQLFLYSYMFFPWMIVPLQVLNILGQSFLWAVISHQTNLTMTTSWSNKNSTRRVNEVYVFARASQQRALQTAYMATYQGISFACGSILAGFAYDLSGGSLIPFLRVSAGFISGWALVYMLYQCCCFPNRRQRKYSKLLEDSDDEEDFIYNASDHKNSCFMKVDSAGGYVKNNGTKRSKRVKRNRGLREKRRNKEELSSSSNDEDYSEESDWLKMALKKDSRRL